MRLPGLVVRVVSFDRSGLHHGFLRHPLARPVESARPPPGALRSEIAGSMTALSRHLALLRRAGLVVPRRDGQRNVYALTDAGRDLRRVLVGMVGGDAPRGVSRAGRSPASGQILTDAKRPRRTEEPTKREEPTR
jgi:DNA-binding transcriptional ArsR family regulator